MTFTRKILPATAAAAALVLLAAGSAVGAGDDDAVDITVEIEDLAPVGALTMTVAPNNGVTLDESGSDADVRQFVGTLPTVTISDTREDADIPDGAWWAVVGQATDFTGAGLDPISSEYFGWTPRILSATGDTDVAEGDPVTSLVDAVDPNAAVPEAADGTYAGGLVGQELLTSTWASGTGSWDVTADLALRVSADVDAGTYGSTLTLSLFESE